MIVAIDFETYLIGKDAIFPKPVCLSSYDGNQALLHRKEDMKEYLRDILQKAIIIAHNVVFECGVIITHFPELTNQLFAALDEGRIYCTKVAEQLNNILRKKAIHSLTLSNLVWSYFKEDISATKEQDAWRMRYSELENVDVWPQEAIQYVLDDSIWAYKLYSAQEKRAQKECVKAAVYLNLIGATGLKIDLNRASILRREVTAHLKPHYELLISREMCVKTKEGKYKKEVKKLQGYVKELGVQLMYTNSGQPSVKSEALETYKHQVDDEILNSFAHLSLYEKVIAAYLNRMTEDIIYSQYSAVKNTCRTSSNGTDLFPSLNIQQLPRKVENVTYDLRNCFVPRSGRKILSIDYAGIELCSTAYQLFKIYGKSSMLDKLNSGNSPIDMHSLLAAKIKKIPYDHFILNKAKYKEDRQKAKPINLGFPGGLGYDTMRTIMWKDGIRTEFKILQEADTKQELFPYLYALCRDDLRIARLSKYKYALVKDELITLKKNFLSLYPELEMFLKEGHKQFLTGEYRWVQNDFGEVEEEPMYAYEVYGFKRDWCTYTALCNGLLMQTPSAIGAKRAVCRIVRDFWRHPEITPLAFIHDEILFEVIDNSRILDNAEELSYIMIDEMKTVFPSVRITVEASLSDQWQKADGYWTKKFWSD